jgi:hypothetical protein
MLWFLKYFHRKKIGQKLAFLTQSRAKLSKILIIILVFEKNAIFSPKIANNCDHNIDPRNSGVSDPKNNLFSGIPEDRSGRSLSNTFPFQQLSQSSQYRSPYSAYFSSYDQSPIVAQNPYRARYAHRNLSTT